MIYWIHGAFSTPRSFNWLIDQMPQHVHCRVAYDTKWTLAQNVRQVERQIATEPTAFVGHSLGGLLAAIMVSRGRASRGVSISAPMCGFCFGPAAGRASIDVLAHQFTPDFLNVVTHRDRVVPPRMQRLARGAAQFESPVNHFEVMLDPDVAGAIRGHLFAGDAA